MHSWAAGPTTLLITLPQLLQYRARALASDPILCRLGKRAARYGLVLKPPVVLLSHPVLDPSALQRHPNVVNGRSHRHRTTSDTPCHCVIKLPSHCSLSSQLLELDPFIHKATMSGYTFVDAWRQGGAYSYSSTPSYGSDTGSPSSSGGDSYNVHTPGYELQHILFRLLLRSRGEFQVQLGDWRLLQHRDFDELWRSGHGRVRHSTSRRRSCVRFCLLQRARHGLNEQRLRPPLQCIRTSHHFECPVHRIRLQPSLRYRRKRWRRGDESPGSLLVRHTPISFSWCPVLPILLVLAPLSTRVSAKVVHCSFPKLVLSPPAAHPNYMPPRECRYHIVLS